LEEKPKITDEIRNRMEEARAKAEAHGHKLGEWKWDCFGHWHARCQKRNCLANVWVSSEKGSAEPYGGNAI
jgi:hypothetical protein